ncbi:ferrous iron transport protein A [Natroniella sp. ANB-PHB2]|uniref:FeoA family protein n=1 Tax=Natroniella sp. ANB-PHB2 TaxID=3384444 RepID=UPI0038D4290B
MGVSLKKVALNFIGGKEELVEEELTLDKLKPGDKAVISAVPDHSLLSPLGFRIGKKVELKTKQPCGGPVVAAVEGRNVAIGRKLAKKIEMTSGAQYGS